MKSILLSFASLLVTVSAFAMPSIGDIATYNVTITQNGQSMDGTMETSITAFDQSSGMFNVQTSMNFNGQSQVQSEQKAAQDLISDQMATAIIANCTAYKGTLESVTVPAGTFQTCALPNDPQAPGTTWLASGVAFGLVKADMTQSDGTHIHGELASFKNGN